VLVVWPKGILELNLLKGYSYLAYMAISRKTFVPIGPLQLWTHKLAAYPLEFILPLLALVASIVFWKKLMHRSEALPFIVYAGTFFLATCVITVPFTYYHESLMGALAVVVGVVFGQSLLWRPLPARVLATGILAATLAGSCVLYYRETVETRVQRTLRSAV